MIKRNNARTVKMSKSPKSDMREYGQEIAQ